MNDTKTATKPVNASPDASTFENEASTFISGIQTAFGANLGPKAQDAVFSKLGSGASVKGRPVVATYLAAIAILSDRGMNYDRRAQLCRLANKAQALAHPSAKLDGTGANKLTRVCPEKAHAGIDNGKAAYKLVMPVALEIEVSSS